MLHGRPQRSKQSCHLSVPFSSGQGMLRLEREIANKFRKPFSPLFIGARNVTRLSSIDPTRQTTSFQSPFHRGKECYNPVVQSVLAVCALSVPFSSGQGMLPPFFALHIITKNFQSPFHRGKECYTGAPSVRSRAVIFQSPFHRGKECYIPRSPSESVFSILSVPFSSGQGMLRRGRIERAQLLSRLSVPFSSGQGMLRTGAPSVRSRAVIFQSPFHRGKECYLDNKDCSDIDIFIFQSPFHRGKECYSWMRS